MLKNAIWHVLFLVLVILSPACKKEEDTPNPPPGSMQLLSAKAGQQLLTPEGPNTGVPVDSVIHLKFSQGVNFATISSSIMLQTESGELVEATLSQLQSPELIDLTPVKSLEHVAPYTLKLTNSIKGSQGESFAGVSFPMTTENGKLILLEATLNGTPFLPPSIPREVDFQSFVINMVFSHPLDPQSLITAFSFSDPVNLTYELSDSNHTVTITSTQTASYLWRYFFIASGTIRGANGFGFQGFVNSFVTRVDSTPKFPVIGDDALLELIESQTFRYFYDFAHPASGMSRERNTSGDIVTSGGSGFGIMALVVGMHRGFITRTEGLTRFGLILSFLETSDRHHGAWPHWLNGQTGSTVPFSTKDDGGDLVETSYLVQGLITIRQYLDPSVQEEQVYIDRIDALISGVEYDWYTRGENALYWHWSPNQGWIMNMKVEGYNEALITHIVAASSLSHPVSPTVYHQGWARNGSIINGNTYYNFILPVGYAYGGPLFFAHYSFLGLDPRNLQDQYASYWEQNRNHSLINQAYCVDNPKNFIGYGTDCWGLTACDNPWGYNAHSPTNDLGVIAPTAAISSLPYTPDHSLAAIRHFYYTLGDRLWGPYGFYDSFCPEENWWGNSYIAIDQGPIICMIENYRSGLLWDLFMSYPAVGKGLSDLGFSH